MLFISQRPLLSRLTTLTFTKSPVLKPTKHGIHVSAGHQHNTCTHRISVNFIRSQSVCIYSNFSRNKSTAIGSRRKGVTSSRGKEVHVMAHGHEKDSGWLELGKFRVYPWALSGLESCIVVEADHFKEPITFDIGHAHRASVKCKHVFITHGHMDHTSGIVSHWAKRNLLGAKPATYYVPQYMESKLHQAASLFYSMNEGSDEVIDCPIQIQSLNPGEEVQIPGALTVKPFKTNHRVASQGYIVYKTWHKLKPEYEGLSGKVLQELHKNGTELRINVTTPEVAYTGDTTFQVFESLPNPDLLKVKLLIVESTYIDNDLDSKGNDGITRARNRGHMNLQEILDHREMFREIENIVLVHLSDKYSVSYIRRRMQELVPEDLRRKIHVGVVMKESRI